MKTYMKKKKPHTYSPSSPPSALNKALMNKLHYFRMRRNMYLPKIYKKYPRTATCQNLESVHPPKQPTEFVSEMKLFNGFRFTMLLRILQFHVLRFCSLKAQPSTRITYKNRRSLSFITRPVDCIHTFRIPS